MITAIAGMPKSHAVFAACLLMAGCGDRQSDPGQSRTGQAQAKQAEAGHPDAVPVPALRAEVAFPGLSFERPLFLAASPDGTDRVFVVEQCGRVWAFANRPDVKPAERVKVLDLTAVVLAPGNAAHPGANEEGLLGFAFHPKFAENRTVFAHYSITTAGYTGGKDAGHRRNRLSRFRLSENGIADLSSEEVLLEIDQPETNHNGGMIAFGPDGMLYMGLGDGGGAGDRHGTRGNGQNTGVLLGKILRLDVDHRDEKAGMAYAVPADNPFAGRAGFRPEIWALGLRNPWRFSFDRKTGELWCGDVGQNAHEEVDVIIRGGNYGWRVREGKFPFAEKEQPATLPLIEPVADHGRTEAMSVTGGYVYRGKAIPGLAGWYVYGDFVRGNLWRLRRDGPGASGAVEGPVLLPFQLPTLSSFGEDGAGEIYACCFDGKIYKVVGADSSPLAPHEPK